MAAWTSFAGVPFRVLRLGAGVEITQDWTRPSFVAQRHVPGSDTTDTFLMGQGAPRVTYRIESATHGDYRDLQALVQTSGELQIPTGISTAEATEVDFHGQIYDRIADVTLVELQNAIAVTGGKVRVDATFEGAW